MIEEYIYKEGDQFTVKRKINDVCITFGTFDNLEDAIEYRDEMEDYGWPYNPQNDDIEKIEPHIYLENNRYVVSKKIMDKIIIFGSFSQLETARKYKYKLLENAWNLNVFTRPLKYSKYIFKIKDDFYIYKKINGVSTSFGHFKNLDDAVLVRDNFIDNNWGMDDSKILENLGVVELEGLNKNIGKIGRKYTVFRWKGSKCTFFGFYNNLRTAMKVKDKLFFDLDSNFYDFLEEHQKDTRYISNIQGHYRISKSINGEIYYFGYYDSLDEAIKIRDKLIDNGWDGSFLKDKVTKKGTFKYNKGIHNTSRGFEVVKRIDGILYNFGAFDTLEEALDYQNELKKNNYYLDMSEEEEFIEEKYDEFIFLRKDDKYYLENEIDGETRIFGIFDNPLDAIAARLDCMRNNWDLSSVCYNEVDEDYNNFGQLNNDVEDVTNEIIYSKIADEILGFPVTVGKSYKNKGWAVKRSYLDKLIPYIPYEKECVCFIEGIEVKCKINIHTRLFYNYNERLSDYLKKLSQINEKVQTRVDLTLNYGLYSLVKSNNSIKFTTCFSKSFKNGLFACPREFSKGILPILDYESNASFSVNNIQAKGKLNLEFRIKFSNKSLISKLELYKEEGDPLDVVLML